MFAVIKTGGKQYKVKEGDKIKIEKIDAEPGSKVIFDEVLLKSEKEKIDIGGPILKGCQVEGQVLGVGRGRKKIVFHYRPRKRFRKKKGHRQYYTEVEITKISA